MNQPEEPIILAESEEAASLRTVTGWVSRDGHFYGADERLARYAGSTHRRCENEGCENITEKHWTRCKKCRDEQDIAKFFAMPKKPWDGVGMIFSNACDEFFGDLGDAQDFAEDRGLTLADLRLVICEPNYLHPVYEDHWCDDLPEDGELPDDVEEARRALNKAIEGAGPVSWRPGKFALDLSTITQA